MAKMCNRTCPDYCPYDDCILDTISPTERKEIRERDNRYYNTTGSKMLRGTARAKHKYNK